MSPDIPLRQRIACKSCRETRVARESLWRNAMSDQRSSFGRRRPQAELLENST
jgi:hypothetical protein